MLDLPPDTLFSVTALTFKTGKKPAVDKPTDLQFERYRTTLSGIVVPQIIGFSHVFGGNWPMLGNDAYGDCVFAGGDHETSLLNWIGFGAHKTVVTPQVQFVDENALSDYGAVTGFNPNDPSTDQGTVTQDALDYRRHTGLIDSRGVRHKIGAYVKLPLRNLTTLREALFLFEAIGVGIRFPASAMDQFNNGQPWTPVRGSQIEGGHYIPFIAAEPGWFYCVTWGATQKVSDAFVSEYADELWGILSIEGLYRRAQTDYAGYNWTQLIADAKVVGSLVGG